MKGKEERNSSVGFEPGNEELPFEVDVEVCLRTSYILVYTNERKGSKYDKMSINIC